MTEAIQDVLIVGAGLSGIGAACHLERECPGKSYTIFEARDAIGGTWDLFRYPGIRSDSDMFTLGYNFKPWRGDRSLTDGPSIKAYVEEAAQEYGVNPHIQFGHRVTRADWSSAAMLPEAVMVGAAGSLGSKGDRKATRSPSWRNRPGTGSKDCSAPSWSLSTISTPSRNRTTVPRVWLGVCSSRMPGSTKSSRRANPLRRRSPMSSRGPRMPSSITGRA